MKRQKRSMMKNGLLITITIILLMSCSKDENLGQIKEKFHGKYEMISSVSSVPVDLNMDGISSNKLLNENPEYLKAGIMLLITEGNGYLFEEKWPVEYIETGTNDPIDSTSYHSNYLINYAMYMNASLFQFDDNYKSIQLHGIRHEDSTNKLISVESVTVEENEIIKVVTVRKLYTINGWATTKIESRYKRYTIIT